LIGETEENRDSFGFAQQARMLRQLNVAFIMCLLSFVMQYVNLQSMFSLKLTFERGTLFSVGRYRLSTGMLAVPLLCSGVSHSRGSYVVIRNFVCVCV
jgi:hypothetical protein